MRLRVRRLANCPRARDGRVDLDTIVDALRPLGPVAVLESAGPRHDRARWSYVFPVPVGRLRATSSGSTTLRTPDGIRLVAGDPLDGLDRYAEELGLDPHAPLPPGGLPPFTGGLAGAFAYELGRDLELPASPDGGDLFDLAVIETVIAVDRMTDEAVLVQRPLISDDDGLTAQAEAVAGCLRRGPHGHRPRTRSPAPSQPVETSLDPGAYQAAVAEVLDLIARGETFQVNLTQRLSATWHGDLHDLYRALRRQSPAAYGAALPLAAGGIASISPETFLEVRDGRVTTRPIKGTRPRSADPECDADLATDLVESTKDRAENVMVVDMQRNDLGRVAETGSVHVPSLCELEAHPTVWHLVSEVGATLRTDIGWAQLLRAVCPPASVTGTPKVRAMQAIDDLEPVPRGWYCGAVGVLGVGMASLAVAIRTATLDEHGRAHYGAGGGIVAGSDPAAEHRESLDKAAAFLRAVAADEPAVGRVAS